MTQGYPDQGGDTRLLPGLGWLQRTTIIHAPPAFHRKEVFGWTVTWHVLPPFLMLEKVRYDSHLYVRRLSMGWMWRKAQSYFMWEAACKKDTGYEPDYR